MFKILTIAVREYRAMVGTKAFLISICMMPVLMFGSILAMELLRRVGSAEDHRVAVIDHSQRLFESLDRLAAQRRGATANGADRPAAADGPQEREFGGDVPARIHLEQVAGQPVDDALRWSLAERVRAGKLFAFIEIPADAIELDGNGRVAFFSQDAGLSETRQWLEQQINQVARDLRLKAAGIDPQLAARASRFVAVASLGLPSRAADGSVQPPKEKDEMGALFLPMGVMMLMFMVIFLAAQPMLESVLEEKSQRIAEVLLGSANPFQLMSGKLLGTVAGSLTVFGIYLAGIITLAINRGWTDLIPWSLVPWFVTFQLLGVLFYASIFMAVGAFGLAAQGGPVDAAAGVDGDDDSVLRLAEYRARSDSALAVGISMFPPATPATMILRLSTGAAIPLWQPIAGVLISVATTLLVVVLSGRIFRVGLLWQGKTPKFSEMVRWALCG